MSADYVTDKDQQGRWYWRCLVCGWLGIDCGSENFADVEARSHLLKDHDQDEPLGARNIPPAVPSEPTTPDLERMKEHVAKLRRSLAGSDTRTGLAMVSQVYADDVSALIAEIERLRGAVGPSPSLFALGDFAMHSGDVGHWKIECDALTDDDMACLAFMFAERLPAFGSVYGIPTGGVRIADALQQYATEGPRLLVDDVLTTGTSMEEARSFMSMQTSGAVLFARADCPSWITPLFSMNAKSTAVGPSPEQIDACERYLEESGLVIMYESDAHPARIVEPSGPIHDLLVAACSVRGTTPENAETEE